MNSNLWFVEGCSFDSCLSFLKNYQFYFFVLNKRDKKLYKSSVSYHNENIVCVVFDAKYAMPELYKSNLCQKHHKFTYFEKLGSSFIRKIIISW